ncbi:MAG TPA: DUF3090 family protein [Methylomirabilota bacterium]|nr:DUF3090 family protein [Methylomirabilota bacterium]
MSESFDFKAPDFFTTGTVGPPGQRVFYLQAREGGVVLTLKVEKEQVGALAEYVAGLLAKLPAAAARPEPVSRDLALLEPFTPAWPVRSLAVGYDESRDRVVIVAEEELREDDEEEEEQEHQREEAAADRASARVTVSRAQAMAFVERARALVRAGRPTCPFCSRPMNPEGHICPRQNGASRD